MLMRVCLTFELRYIILWCMIISIAGLYFYLTWRGTNLRVVEFSVSHDLNKMSICYVDLSICRLVSICYQPDVVLIY